MSKLYRALKEFKEHKVFTTETKEHKTRVMNHVVTLYNNYFNSYEKMIIDTSNNKIKEKDAAIRFEKSMFDLTQLRQEEKTVFQNKMILVVYQLFNSFGFKKDFAPLFSEKESEQTKEKVQKPLWFEINKPKFSKLTRDIYDNQDNKDFKNMINKRTYDLKNAKEFWMEVTTRKISKSEAKKLCKELIRKDIDALENKTSNDIVRYNILQIRNNVGAIFAGSYLH